MTLLQKYIWVLVGLTLIVGVLRIFYIFRAIGMRALAARWGFQYVGPPAPKWWNPLHTKINPPVPGWFSQVNPGGWEMRQIWNVIEGQHDGASVFIFDSVIGRRGGQGCTLIAFHTEQSPFGTVTWPDRVIQSHGWTILHGVWFLMLSWPMSIRRLDGHLRKLRIGSANLVEKVL